ncbi:MAG: YbaB/EbfC family nucleoid-associated protein [Robiginitomaculum sp.]|nr:YbaB/EbfC family nucleoid-associated protein [Robiginitomaculum sp.]
MKDISGLMKQAKEMQENLAKAQEKLAEIEVVGESAGGMVCVTLNGKGQAKAVKIEPTFLVPSEVEVLEDLIVAAVNDAKRKVDRVAGQQMADAAGPLAGMMPPGMKLPF